MTFKNIIKVAHYYQLKYKFASDASDKVKAIFNNSDQAYIEKTLQTRNPGSSIQAGSVFSSAQTLESLLSADWEEYFHPNINSPAVAFKANIPGKLGVIELKTLPLDMPVKFQASHAGAVGDLAEVVADYNESMLDVEHTTLIAGPGGKDPNELTVWTFFPGDPTPKPEQIPLSTLIEKYPSGEATVKDAIAEGFVFVKKMS